MSQLKDLKTTVFLHCIENELTDTVAKELMANIAIDLEWDRETAKCAIEEVSDMRTKHLQQTAN